MNGFSYASPSRKPSWNWRYDRSTCNHLDHSFESLDNNMSHKTQLTTEQLDGLARELDALRTEITSDLGERDANHIRKIVRRAQGSAIAGRGLLMFGFDPISWVVGVFALAHAKILEEHGNRPQRDARSVRLDERS